MQPIAAMPVVKHVPKEAKVAEPHTVHVHIEKTGEKTTIDMDCPEDQITLMLGNIFRP